MKKITKILHHDISWEIRYKDIKELDPVSAEHIEYCIGQGISEGDLSVTDENDEEFTGYWYIINWREVALDLYNSFVADPKVARQVAAMKRFDNEWVF
jgi:hypothetical protein